MKYCFKCGNALEEDAMVCDKCGQDQSSPIGFEKDSSKISSNLEENLTSFKESTNHAIKSIQQNEKVKKGVSQASIYGRYFLSKLISPDFNIKNKDSRYGFVNLACLILMQVLFLFIVVNNFLSSAYLSYDSLMGLMYPLLKYRSPSFIDDVSLGIGLIGFFVIFYGSMALISYLIIRVFFRLKTKLTEVINQIGQMCPVLVVINFLIGSLSVLGVLSIQLAIGLFILSLLFYISINWIYVIEHSTLSEKVLVNRYYILLFSPIIYFIALFVEYYLFFSTVF